MTAEDRAAAVRPTPVASFIVEPSDPAGGEEIRFLDLSYDPAGEGIAFHTWDLGDGTTSIAAQPTHRYARDGVYDVSLRVTARDGRVGVGSARVAVATHDIRLTRIDAPSQASAGEHARVVVAVASRHRAEIAQVELLRQRSVPEWESVAIQTRPIPGHRGLDVVFDVTFDDADAEVGHVSFRATATLVGAADATPDDNALTAPPTLVVKRR
jgi:hypothetical protein